MPIIDQRPGVEGIPSAATRSRSSTNKIYAVDETRNASADTGFSASS
jgi:hypothetical protein